MSKEKQNLTHGQRSLLFAIHSCIENLEGAMTSEQQKELASALLLLRLPLDFEDAVNTVMKLDDAGFETTSKVFQKFMDVVADLEIVVN